MKDWIQIGVVVLAAGIVWKMFLGGSGDSKEHVAKTAQNGALIIDTRTAGEFAGGHIPEAVNIPYNRIAQSIAKYETDTSRPIIVYCHSGARSAVAKKSLIRAGYTNVVNGGSLGRMRKQLNSN